MNKAQADTYTKLRLPWHELFNVDSMLLNNYNIRGLAIKVKPLIYFTWIFILWRSSKLHYDVS